VTHDLGAPLVAVLVRDLLELVLDDLEAALLAFQDERSSAIVALTSPSSASSCSISSPVSFARRMLRIASVCRSES
jgi:hypothetical protein